MRVWITALFLCSAFMPLWSQASTGADAAAGSLIYASGTSFEIVRDGKSEVYDLAADIVEGLDFYPGDYINTYKGTFLEIQVTGSRNVLKIAENTSFKIDEASEPDSSRYKVSYGRVRARVQKLAGLSQFALTGPSMVAGVRGTDFGYDILYNSEKNTTVASVYCFEGQVEVQPTVNIVETEADLFSEQGVELSADEMLSVYELSDSTENVEESPAVPRYAFQRDVLSSEIQTFWRQNDFQATPIAVSPESEFAAETETSTDTEDGGKEPPPGAQFNFTQSQLRRGSLLTAGIGAVFGAAALTFAYADPLVGDMNRGVRDNLALSMSISSGLFFSTSVFTLIASLF
ncbi:MAG: FecR family protein [Spirochaetaceae bacterium]|nr:FecR family protein [Spirochaetaceae bacterium]MCF7947090.1 FecR family protein [Spirochaetia bacterium]MCF7950091.1 FecR family protein [Spirochaetaceae bacterium]